MFIRINTLRIDHKTGKPCEPREVQEILVNADTIISVERTTVGGVEYAVMLRASSMSYCADSYEDVVSLLVPRA